MSATESSLRNVLLTAFRKILKMSRKVDESPALRSRICCSPESVYDHRLCAWEPFRAATLCQWTESRIFLDALIRQLNDRRQFFLPAGDWEESRKDTASCACETEASAVTGAIPAGVLPYTPLSKTARVLFDSCPFSMLHINNAFAAVKELGYITSKPTRDATSFASPSLRQLASKIQLDAAGYLPQSVKSASVVYQGLTEDIRRHLQGLSGTPGSSEGDYTAEGSGDAADGLQVKLLIAHPQVIGYFRHCVMLLVEHTRTSAAAFVLNKMLLSDLPRCMPLGSVIRMSAAHSLWSLLKDKPVLLGGPVLPTGTERALTLLHRVKNVRKAVRVGDTLWLNGDLDDLEQKLKSQEASVDDVLVLCGFAAWGPQQLEGEVASGTWIVASKNNSSGDSAGTDVGEFVFELARSSTMGDPSKQFDASNLTNASSGKTAPNASGGESYLSWLGLEEEGDGSRDKLPLSGVASWSTVFSTFTGEIAEFHKNC